MRDDVSVSLKVSWDENIKALAAKDQKFEVEHTWEMLGNKKGMKRYRIYDARWAWLGQSLLYGTDQVKADAGQKSILKWSMNAVSMPMRSHAISVRLTRTSNTSCCRELSVSPGPSKRRVDTQQIRADQRILWRRHSESSWSDLASAAR